MARARDFDRPRSGRRLRLQLQVYDRATRTFRSVREGAALVTVSGAGEQARLWSAISAAIEAGDWRDQAPSTE